MHIGQKVRIRKLDYNDHLAEYECLSVGSEGRIVDVEENPWRDDKRYIVKLSDGKRWPFYREELEVIR